MPREETQEGRSSPQPHSRLARRLGTGDAVVVGLGSMLGAGVFVAVGPAAEAAGSGLLAGLALAALVAYANAMSSARLAAVHPVSGGAYAYGRRQLGSAWGALAGWAFLVGKVASCVAIALAFGRYAWPEMARPLAVGAVVACVVVNHRGIGKTVGVTRVLVAAVLASLAVAVVSALTVPEPVPLESLWSGGDPAGVLRAAAILFYAFAGYARIATLGEEVTDPVRTIPRAIPIALAIVLVVYAAVALAALVALGQERLAEAEAPLAEAVAAGRFPDLAVVVRVGAALATLGVLLSLLAGVGRTAFAMASDGELPGALSAVHPRFAVPARAGLAVGLAVLAGVTVAPLEGAITMSAFTVLAYYAVANASALTLRGRRGRSARWALPVVGLIGCVALAFSLSPATILVGTAAVALPMAARAIVLTRRHK